MKSNISNHSKVLIAYFSWSSNTKNIAEKIQDYINADVYEVILVNPYSNDYNTVLKESQKDKNIQSRPEIENHMDNMGEYDTIILGFPNWWASIPMPIAAFLEEYDFSGKVIIPFCSHGGGGVGQSLTAISKLVPQAVIGEVLSVHYSGDSNLNDDIKNWLEKNNIAINILNK